MLSFCLGVIGAEFQNLQKQSPGGVLLKSVIKNLAIFTGKHFCRGLFLIKLQTQFHLKRDSGTGVF